MSQQPTPNVESDRKAGIQVVAHPHPTGEAGPRLTLREMARRIRDCRTPSMRAFAEKIISETWPDKTSRPTEAQVGQALLDYVRNNMRYRHDPPMTEMVQSAAHSLCLDGVVCIPVGDCDDRCVALGGLMIAYGMDVLIMRQKFSTDGADEHVLCVFKTEDGSWLTADPSSPDMPVGVHADAAEQEFIDPCDVAALGLPEKEAGTFVGVGSLPSAAERRHGQRMIRVSRDTRLVLGAKR